MLDARDVARFLVQPGYCAESPEESIQLCPMRLQKLLYYCQGWCLALLGKPLFHQEIEAWENGPVVRDVYDVVTSQRGGIDPTQYGNPKLGIQGPIADLIHMIWQEHTQYSPEQLSAMTQSEPAWLEARQFLPETEGSSNALSHDTMAWYFEQLADELSEANRKPGWPQASPQEVWQSDLDYYEHPERAVSLDEAMRQTKQTSHMNAN